MDLRVVRASGRQRFDAGGFPTMHQTRRSLQESTWYRDGQSERRSPSVGLARPPAPRRDGRTYSLSAPAASCAPSWNGASNGAANASGGAGVAAGRAAQSAPAQTSQSPITVTRAARVVLG